MNAAKAITGLVAIGIFLAASGTAQAGPIGEFKIQRGEIDVTGTGVSIAAGLDYEAPASLDNAFVRIVNTRLSGGGKSSGGGNQNSADWNVSISNPGDLLNSINFARYSNSNNTRVTWEIIEYVGALGGPNEFIVRAHDQIENTAQSATGAAVAGIADDADVVPFITGQRVNADNRDNAHLTMHYSSWDDTTDEPTFTRGVSSATAAAISYAVVEFTGSNWDIDRAVYDFGTSTGNDQTVTIDPVDLGKTFIHAQNTATETGLNDQGVDTRLTAADTVSYSVWTDTDQVGVAWIIENTEADPDKDMVVQHVEGNKPKGGGDGVAWTESISGVWNLSATSIMGESATSDGTGTAHPRGSINLQLTAADEVTLWWSDDGQPNEYSFDVVEWPMAYILDLTWDGAGPGTWGDPSRWTPGPNTPDASEDAFIDTANTVTVAADQAANNLTVSNDGVVQIAADKRLDVTTDLDAAGGSVVLDNSTLAVGGRGSIGTLTADNNATLTAGGSMTVGSAALNNSTLAIGGGGAITTLTADGNTTLSAGGSMAVASYSDNGTATALTLGGGAAFDLQAISTVAGSSFRVEGSSLRGPAVAKPLGDAQTLVLAGGTYTFADVVGAAASGTAPSGNVVAHWAFDDGTGTNAQNSANPGTNDGTLENFPVDDSQWVPGLIGTGALEFDGSDDQVSIVGYQGIPGADARTMAGWVKTPGTKADADIMSWGNNSGGQKWVFRIQDDNGQAGAIRIEVNGGYIVGETVVNDDAWHYVAAVVPDGATHVQDIQLYVDGQPETPSATGNRTINTASDTDVMIGSETWDAGRVWLGTMDDLYLYDRALTAAEVAETYATHTPPDVSALHVTVDAGTATLASESTSEVAFADLTMKQGGTLATASLYGSGISFTGGTTIEAGATAVGFDPQAPTDLNAIDGSAAPNVVITKTGDGELVLDDASTDLAATATINVEGGTVIGYHGSNPFDEARLKVSGGRLLLSAKPAATSPVTYDNAVVADGDGAITAGAGAAGHIGLMTVNLGSAGRGVTINSGNTLTLRTTDDYTLNVAGSVAGGGLAVDQGTVNLAGATVDDLNVSGTGQVNLSTSINTTNLSVSNTSLHAGAHRVTVAETGVMTLGRSTYTATTGAFQVTGDVTRSVADTLILGGPGSVVTLGLTPFQGVSIGNDTNANFPTGGGLVVNGDTYTVTASGGDMWGSSDGCYLAYLEFGASEAIDISAYVGVNGFVGGTNGWRKAGLMARDSLDPGSRNAITLIADADGNGINAQIRKEDNVGSIGCANNPGTSAYIGRRTAHDTPVWLRLEYLGDGASFNYYWSEDPVANGWTLINDPAWDTEGKVTSPTLLDAAMTDTIYVGLALTSHNTSQQTTFDFDNLAGFGFGEPTTVNNVTGEGTIAGDVLIAGSLAPGGSIGEIAVLGDLALDATATYDVEVDGALIDLVTVTGDLALAGVLSIDGLLTEDMYTIMTYGGDLSGVFDDISDVVAQGLTVDYSVPGAVQITPEPASLAFIALGALGLLLRRKRG